MRAVSVLMLVLGSLFPAGGAGAISNTYVISIDTPGVDPRVGDHAGRVAESLKAHEGRTFDQSKTIIQAA